MRPSLFILCVFNIRYVTLIVSSQRIRKIKRESECKTLLIMDENLYLFWSREKLVQNNELQDLRMIWNFVTLSLISRLEYFIPVHKLSEPYQINTFFGNTQQLPIKAGHAFRTQYALSHKLWQQECNYLNNFRNLHCKSFGKDKTSCLSSQNNRILIKIWSMKLTFC